VQKRTGLRHGHGRPNDIDEMKSSCLNLLQHQAVLHGSAQEIEDERGALLFAVESHRHRSSKARCPAQIEAPKLVRAAGCARHANRQNSFHTAIHFPDQLEFNLDLQHGSHRSTRRRDWYAHFYRVRAARKTQKLIAFASRLQS
jgi:hypothetical protein